MPQDLDCVNSRVAVDFHARDVHPISNYRGRGGCDASATLTMAQKRQKLAQLSLRRVSGRLRRLAGSRRRLVGASGGPSEVDGGLPLSKLRRFSWR